MQQDQSLPYDSGLDHDKRKREYKTNAEYVLSCTASHNNKNKSRKDAMQIA